MYLLALTTSFLMYGAAWTVKKPAPEISLIVVKPKVVSSLE